MVQRHLDRDYFFEFAGMPQSGKSTVEDIVAHYLKREGFFIGEYRGGSKGSPLYNAPIAALNLLLACEAAKFIVSTAEREKETHKIFLLDRGLIDRCLFTRTLVERGRVHTTSAGIIENFLTLPELIDKIDGVFVFMTSPELALTRENEGKLPQEEGEKEQGGVMNEAFLRDMQSAVGVETTRLTPFIRNQNVILFDTHTEEYNGKGEVVAEMIVKNILKTINSSVTGHKKFTR